MAENEKIGFFQESPNNYSVGRLIIFILSVTGVLFSGAMLGAGLFKYITTSGGESLGTISASCSGLLVSVCGTALTFKAISKKEETKTE